MTSNIPKPESFENNSVSGDKNINQNNIQNYTLFIRLKRFFLSNQYFGLIVALLISLLSIIVIILFFYYLLPKKSYSVKKSLKPTIHKDITPTSSKSIILDIATTPTSTIKIITNTSTPTPTESFKENYISRYNYSRTGSCDCVFNNTGGRLKWKIRPGDWGASSPPALANDFLYFVGYDSHLYEIDYKTGETIWKFKLDKFSRYAPEIFSENIYIGDDTGTVYSINLKTKSLNWKKRFTYNKIGSTYNGPVSMRSPIHYYDGGLYFSDNSSVLYCLDANTSKELWKFEALSTFSYSSPAFYENTMYVGSGKGFLYALNIKTGIQQWSKKFDDPISTNPIVYEDMIIVNPSNSAAFVLEKSSGDIKWKFNYTQEGGGSYASPQSGVVSNDILYLGGSSDKVLDVFDLNTGNKLWQFTAESWIESSPTEAGDSIYFGTYDRQDDHHGYIYAINSNTREELWKFRTNEYGFATPPVVYKNMVFAKDGHGTIFALE